MCLTRSINLLFQCIECPKHRRWRMTRYYLQKTVLENTTKSDGTQELRRALKHNNFVKCTFSHRVVTANVPLEEVVEIETWIWSDGDCLWEQRHGDVLSTDRVVERASDVVLDVVGGSSLRVGDDEPAGRAHSSHLQHPVSVDASHARHFRLAWNTSQHVRTTLGLSSFKLAVIRKSI